MKHSRVRFTVRRMMVIVAVAAVTLAYLGNGSTKLGCGKADILLTFRIADDRDGRPVPGAAIELSSDYSLPASVSVTTGTDGSAKAIYRAGATWYRGPFFRTYRCVYYSEGVRITAPGYRPVESLLRNYTADHAYQASASPPAIRVRLQRELPAETPHGRAE